MEQPKRLGLWRRRGVLATAAIVFLAAAGLLALRIWTRLEPEIASAPPTARLISPQQYLNAIHDLFGTDIQVDASFPLPQRRYGLLSLGAIDMVVTPGLLDQFDRVARSVAAQVLDERRRKLFVPCRPGDDTAPDDACARKFFTEVGRFLYRRPLTDTESKLHVAAAREATESSGDFYAGLTHSLAAMLVAPQFLFFDDMVEPDPRTQGRYRLDAASKATRLSLFLWNSLPDATLLAAAESGKLHEPAELERQVTRMLAEPERIERGVRAFFDDMLLFDHFAILTKDPVIYPIATTQTLRSAQEQALRLIVDHLLTRHADYRDLFTTSHTFVDASLASLERVPVSKAGWTPIVRDRRMSAGLLSSVGFLAVHSHPGRSSPTLRGKAIREALLCQKVPDPPPNVNFQNFEASLKTTKTARERLSLHSSDAVCAGCHKITDPIGLALENFDSAGQFRERENEAVIDASGEMDGQQFGDLAGLGKALHDHRALGPCLASRLYAHGVGREPGVADRPVLDFFAKRFAEDGYRYPELLRQIATSHAFYAVTLPATQAQTQASVGHREQS